MWFSKVSLYIDDTSIRLLVMSGQRIKKWADTRLEPGMVVDSVVLQEQEVADKIKQLLKSQKIKVRKVNLGYSGMHSLTRPATLPKLPKSMLPEAVIREARRVLPVPLDQLYLSWRPVPGREGRIQVFMSATPRQTADSLVRTLHLAGLEPTRMSIKPLALVKALDVNRAILVDVQPDEFDLIIFTGGVAQPVRTISLPDQELSWKQKIETIVNDLNRTIKFYDMNNPEKPLEKNVPIYISGIIMNKPESRSLLSELSGHPVVELKSSIKNADKLDTGYYMVNLLMSTDPPTPLREVTCAMGNLNVLPAPYLPKPISLTKVTGIPGGIALAGLVIPFVMMMQNTSSNIESMQEQLQITDQVISQKTAQRTQLKNSITELEKQYSMMEMTYSKYRKSVDNIMTNQEIINGDLLLTLNKLNPEIKLLGIAEGEGKLVIQGETHSEAQISYYAQSILDYARSLDLSSRYTRSTVSHLNVRRNQEDCGSNTIEFTLTFEREKEKK